MRRELVAVTRLFAASILMLALASGLSAAPIAMNDAMWTTEHYVWVIPPLPDQGPAEPVLTNTPNDNSSVLADANTATLNGPDGADFFANETWFQSAVLYWLIVPVTGQISFDWSYVSNDAAPDPSDPSVTIPGSPSYDPAGLFVDEPVDVLPGQNPRLIDDAGSLSQNGFATLHVTAGQQLGFYVLSIDNVGGGASLSITNLDLTPDLTGNAVPEPGAGLLFLSGAGLIAIVRRQRRS
jgi:hypothetical protein